MTAQPETIVSHQGERKEWRVNGRRHRLDGPAVIRADGSTEWWLNGQQVQKPE